MKNRVERDYNKVMNYNKVNFWRRVFEVNKLSKARQWEILSNTITFIALGLVPATIILGVVWWPSLFFMVPITILGLRIASVAMDISVNYDVYGNPHGNYGK